MKFALASDIHLEFGPITLENKEDADVLILSGDICVAHEFEKENAGGKVSNFFETCAKNFPNVIYIMGNHEHYHGDIETTYSILKSKLKHLSNVHLLENETVTIGDFIFFGGTLWTNMNKEDPSTLYTVKRYMNDYGYILDSSIGVSFKTFDENGSVSFKERTGHFSPERSMEIHRNFLNKLKDTISENSDKNFFVVGHHAPSKMSTKPRYRDNYEINGAYSSDLSDFILDHPQIKFWTHGHTHDQFDYMIGSTRVLCNPRGYDGYEDISYHFKLNFFET